MMKIYISIYVLVYVCSKFLQFVNTVMQQKFLTGNYFSKVLFLVIYIVNIRSLTFENVWKWTLYIYIYIYIIVKPGEPVIDSFVSGDGKFGFVEMRTIQAYQGLGFKV